MAEARCTDETGRIMDTDLLGKLPSFEDIQQMNSDMDDSLSKNGNSGTPVNATDTLTSDVQFGDGNQGVTEEVTLYKNLEGNDAELSDTRQQFDSTMDLSEALGGSVDIQSNGEPLGVPNELSDTSLLCKILTHAQMENQIEQVFSNEKLPSAADDDSVDIVASVDPLDPNKSLIDPMEDSNSTSDLNEYESHSQDVEDIDNESIKNCENEEVNLEMSLQMTVEDIVVKICNIEAIRQCFVCKRERIAKYTFTHQKEHEFKEYVCDDKCYCFLKTNCNNVQEDFNCISKNLNISLQHERRTLATSRKCTQCARMVKNSHGYLIWGGFEFCKEHCLYRYQQRIAKACTHCKKSIEYNQMGKYLVRIGKHLRQFCCNDCLRVFKQVVHICSYCQSILSSVSNGGYCTTACRARYENLQQPDKPPYNPPGCGACFICDQSKPLTIEFSHFTISYCFCGEECFTTFKFINNLRSYISRCSNCSKYLLNSQLECDRMYSEGAMQYFCAPTCRLLRLIQRRKVTRCNWCKVRKFNIDLIAQSGYFQNPVYVCSLLCLNHVRSSVSAITSRTPKCEQCSDRYSTCEISALDGDLIGFCSANCISAHQLRIRRNETRGDPETRPMPVVSLQTDCAGTRDIYFLEENEPPEVANKMTSVRSITGEKESQISFEMCDNDAQTDLEPLIKMRTVPVPFYIPQPLTTWQCPLPRAVPFPFPLPIPLLVPLLRDSSTEYLKTLKIEPVKPPSDPFEAELLMMAELVAAGKPKDDEETESFSPEGGDTSFNDDMLQMALKMATDYAEPAVDLEGALTANTITPGHHQPMELTSSDDIIHTEPLTGSSRGGPGRGRGRGRGKGAPRGTNSRRSRGRPPAMQPIPMPEPIPPPPPPPPEPIEKPDANMCLKFTFGVNAWKQWVTTKNSELERSSRKLKLFKTDLLQMTADELNYSMCLFVNEVRKPNGAEYAPDTIYYLCLGIQQYLYENGRIDNIFCDTFYDRFTDCLDDVSSKFSSLYNDSHYIVTRVEEEHLWESKQLGAHSPFVLLTTLMFFNTKHFNLTSVEEHMQLSFSHIMKHWKRNPHSGANRQTPVGGRNVLLRFYPPQNPQEANARKRKVYEQQENEDNPLRCPVKLYEFYLSKCPESVKTRNDVFYLLPERSCVPESPVWYSTQALEMKALRKMLHRVKMVKEINVALLTH